jgi:hypothetical protein
VTEQTASIPYFWTVLTDRMDPGFWLLVEPVVRRLMQEDGLDETAAVLRASREYRDRVDSRMSTRR